MHERMNTQVSLRACKYRVLNMITTWIWLIKPVYLSPRRHGHCLRTGIACVCVRERFSADASKRYLFLLLSSQLHLLLLFLQQQGGHVPLLRVGSQQLLPQSGQLVDHHQQLELLLRQRLWGTWRRGLEGRQWTYCSWQSMTITGDV